MIRSEKFWNRVSRRSMGKRQGLGQVSLKIVEATQKHLGREAVVLDFGCGPGSLTTRIAERVASVHGIDTSAGMIEVATWEADRRGIKNVRFTRAELDGGHQQGSFDVVVAFNVLHHVEDVREVAGRVSGLLKPGGLFISSTACLAERSTLRAVALLVTTLGLVPHMKSYKRAELETLITGGGFEVIESQDLSGLPERFVVARRR